MMAVSLFEVKKTTNIYTQLEEMNREGSTSATFSHIIYLTAIPSF